MRLIKAFPLTLNGLRDFNEAIITKGGVKVSEVNPSTMESKLVRHLYFCGEVLDLDAADRWFQSADRMVYRTSRRDVCGIEKSLLERVNSNEKQIKMRGMDIL